MERKNNNRKKLTSLIFLLFITIVMLGAATYAWFTANRIVTIHPIDVEIVAVGGLQISADAFEWKAFLSNDDILNAHTRFVVPDNSINQMPLAMEPVSSVGDVSGGRMHMFFGTVVQDIDNDFALWTERTLDRRGRIGHYIAFDMFLRLDSSEAAGEWIYLTRNSHVSPSIGAQDRGVQNAARVAWVLPYDTAANASNAMPVESALGDLQAQTVDTAFIWEPNYDTHTPNGINNAFFRQGITTLPPSGGPALVYDGVHAEIPLAQAVKLGDAWGTGGNPFRAGGPHPEFPQYFRRVVPDYRTNSGFAATASNIQAFRLRPGVTKVRMYMWIEGQDVDCENNASGTDIQFSVQFSLTAD